MKKTQFSEAHPLKFASILHSFEGTIFCVQMTQSKTVQQRYDPQICSLSPNSLLTVTQVLHPHYLSILLYSSPLCVAISTVASQQGGSCFETLQGFVVFGVCMFCMGSLWVLLLPHTVKKHPC